MCLSNLKKKRKRVIPELPHGDMVEYTQSDLKSMSVLHKVFKQHIPPTENNLNIVKDKNVKCVILLRDPKEAAEAYRRHVKINDDEKYKNPRNNTNMLNKRSAAMASFYREWIKLKDLDNVKIVHFEDLVVDAHRIVNEILEFYKFDPVGSVSLRKERYTGVGIEKLNNKE